MLLLPLVLGSLLSVASHPAFQTTGISPNRFVRNAHGTDVYWIASDNLAYPVSTLAYAHFGEPAATLLSQSDIDRLTKSRSTIYTGVGGVFGRYAQCQVSTTVCGWVWTSWWWWGWWSWSCTPSIVTTTYLLFNGMKIETSLPSGVVPVNIDCNIVSLIPTTSSFPQSISSTTLQATLFDLPNVWDGRYLTCRAQGTQMFKIQHGLRREFNVTRAPYMPTDILDDCRVMLLPLGPPITWDHRLFRCTRNQRLYYESGTAELHYVPPSLEALAQQVYKSQVWVGTTDPNCNILFRLPESDPVTSMTMMDPDNYQIQSCDNRAFFLVRNNIRQRLSYQSSSYIPRRYQVVNCITLNSIPEGPVVTWPTQVVRCSNAQMCRSFNMNHCTYYIGEDGEKYLVSSNGLQLLGNPPVRDLTTTECASLESVRTSTVVINEWEMGIKRCPLDSSYWFIKGLQKFRVSNSSIQNLPVDIEEPDCSLLDRVPSNEQTSSFEISTGCKSNSTSCNGNLDWTRNPVDNTTSINGLSLVNMTTTMNPADFERFRVTNSLIWKQDPSISGQIDVSIRAQFFYYQGYRSSSFDSFLGQAFIFVMDSGINFNHPDLLPSNKRRMVNLSDSVNENNVKFADFNGHGTYVASVIAGRTFGLFSWTDDSCTLYNVKVLNRDNQGAISSLVLGLEEIFREYTRLAQQPGLDKKLFVVNMAIEVNAQSSAVLLEALGKFNESQIVIVTGAGNRGSDACLSSQSNNPYTLAIGALDYNTGRIPSFSNKGSCISAYAPGVNIPGAYFKGGFMLANGTSAAAALATAELALFCRIRINWGLKLSNQLETCLNPAAQIYNSPDGSIPFLILGFANPRAETKTSDFKTFTLINAMEDYGTRFMKSTQLEFCNFAKANFTQERVLFLFNDTSLFTNFPANLRGNLLRFQTILNRYKMKYEAAISITKTESAECIPEGPILQVSSQFADTIRILRERFKSTIIKVTDGDFTNAYEVTTNGITFVLGGQTARNSTLSSQTSVVYNSL